MAKQDSISFFEFTNRFNNEDECREHLFKMRWPNGFKCPKCDSLSYYLIKKRKTYQCTECRYQASVTVGTIMERSHVALVKWFWAIYLVSTDKRGHSATALERELGVTYKTAWYILQRIRTAMFDRNLDYMLDGFVEMDDAYFGGGDNGSEPDKPIKRGRGTTKTKAIVGLSLDKDKHPLFIKMEVVEKLDAGTIGGFADMNVVSGSVISTDAYSSYKQLEKDGFVHSPKVFNPKEDSEHLKWLHVIVSNAKAFISGTYHGIDRKHLHFYLSEFCYRFNRRFFLGELFNRLIFSCLDAERITYAELTV